MSKKLGIAIICSLAAICAAPAALAQAGSHRSITIMSPQESSYLGIGGMDITPERATALKLKEDRGAEIATVYPDSAADKAGLKVGDVVLEYNGQKVEGWEALRRMVHETPIGREVKIGVWRNGAAQTFSAAMGSHKETTFELGGTPFVLTEPPMPPTPPVAPLPVIPEFRTFMPNRSLGIMGEPLGQEAQLAEYFGVKDGVLVRSVNKGSAADKGGIKAGDVITKIDDTPVSTTQQITSALRSGKSNRTVNVTVVRKGKEMSLSVTLENVNSMRGDVWWPEDTDWFVLPFSSDYGVIQGAKEFFPKFKWK